MSAPPVLGQEMTTTTCAGSRARAVTAHFGSTTASTVHDAFCSAIATDSGRS